MRKIQMVDLVTQYEKIKGEVDQNTQHVFQTAQFINGPEVKDLQTELETYLNVKHVIPCANGTDALQIALMALDLQPEDEVITSDFTFAATVEVVGLLKFKPVLVDVDRDTFNVSIEAIERAITPNTKVIIPVHLFGQCADMDGIMALAKKHNLYVVEDTAQAIGSIFTSQDGSKHAAGTIGQIGTTSFFPSKNLGCYGDGGAIFTNDDQLAQIMRSIVNHGMGKRYYYDRLGVNSRLDSVQAAVLRIKLRHLDEYTTARQKAAAFYSNYFSNDPRVETPAIASYSTHVFHQYTLKIKGIDQYACQDFMQAHDVPAMIYYPMPIHTQEAYGPENFKHEDFPVTNELCNSVISLPMHTELDEEQLTYVCKTLEAFLNQSN
jgi:UDP-2-acetamido-2-deoxy-ribo-hexuluronate aminotransferase